MGTQAKFKIIFEDHHVLVVVKPQGISTGSDHRHEESFIAQVQNYVLGEAALRGKKGYLAPIHFLDRPVSGVMVFAKSSKAASRLNEQFRAKSVRKFYLVLVSGRVANAEATLIHYLTKDRDRNFVTVSRKEDPEAKYCELSYENLAVNDNVSLLKVALVTGRSHQIRVQLASMGHPVLGDIKYSSQFHLPSSSGILLHSFLLQFIHPVSKEPLSFRELPPSSWSDYLVAFEPQLFSLTEGQ